MTRGEKRGLDDARNLYSKHRRDGADSASAQEDGCTDVLLFKEAWRALRGAGWTAKPPSRRSLDTRYKYVRPGGNPAGKENADYVLGEVGVVAEYAKQVALHARTMDLSSCGDGVGGDDVEVHGEHSGGTGVEEHGCEADGDGIGVVGVHGGGTDGAGVGVIGGSGYGDGVSYFGGSGDGSGEDGVGAVGVHGAGADGAGVGVIGEDDDGDGIGDLEGRGDRAGGTDEDGVGAVEVDRASDEDANEIRTVGVHVNGGGVAGIGVRSVEVHGCGEWGESELVDADAAAVCEQGSNHGTDQQQGRSAREPDRQVHRRDPPATVESEEDVDNDCPRSKSAAGGGTATLNGDLQSDRQTLSQLYSNTLVAFSPVREKWMAHKKYKQVGTTYIIGRICRGVQKTKKAPLLFQLRWLDSQFQMHAESITVDLVQKGHHNYNILTREPNQIRWRSLCDHTEGNTIVIEGCLEDLEEEYVRFQYPNFQPANLREVEAIQNMHFDPNAQLDEPTDLFRRPDGSMTTVVKQEFRHLFEHSASSSFFAYLPLYFWHQVVHETNNYAALNNVPIRQPFTIQELMTFLGILFYMEVTVKGEYANYWGRQAEDGIFGSVGVDLERVMPLKRFKLLRQALSFRSEVSEEAVMRDPAARIRCLLNILKVTGGKYIDLGRDVALDEASVACRSRFGRHLIVYNPRKPTGKYHFKMYMLCCASTWIAVNFRLHCAVDITDRLEAVTSQEEAQILEAELKEVATVRQHVLEVVRPIYDTQRIVNTDNFYTSVQLLQALRLKGLRGRGTVRGNSKHFPQHVMLDSKESVRGDHRQGVSVEHQMLAASWCDGNIVRVVSNADASSVTTVQRRVGTEAMEFEAPVCVKQYNAYMQGVDRLDQTRARFSISDGHSFQKWHKKLAMAIIDIAQCNAFLTRKMVVPSSSSRDPHRDFMLDLVNELISNKWTEAPSSGQMVYSERTARSSELPSPSPVSPAFSSATRAGSPTKVCTAVSSKQMFQAANRKRRQCIICRWEDRYATEVTDFCVIHAVCLCTNIHPTLVEPYYCPQSTWTCWEKYHRFYLPQKQFSEKGNLRKTSELFKMKQCSSQSNQRQSTKRKKKDVVRSIVL